MPGYLEEIFSGLFGEQAQVPFGQLSRLGQLPPPDELLNRQQPQFDPQILQGLVYGALAPPPYVWQRPSPLTNPYWTREYGWQSGSSNRTMLDYSARGSR